MLKEGRDEAPTVVATPRKARVLAVTPMELPGERFCDEGEIAHGGSATVRKIYDTILLRHSAMKVMSEKLRPFGDECERFIEEAQITAQLDHPNIVPIHELSVTRDGALYFTMKLIEGYTLKAMLAAREGEVRRFDWVAAFLEILVKVCDAMSFAHSRGVIHRDLKPGNIMVGAFGQVYVMDWGLAKLVGGCGDVLVNHGWEIQDQPGTVLGTAAFMPPEQALGNHAAVDERSDVFALGATLYQILTGHAPYDDEDEEVELAKARVASFLPPEQFTTAARLPRGLCRIASKAMAPDPAARYQTVAELKDELVAQLRGVVDLPRHTFATGDLVVREGEPGDAAYIIERGSCRVFKTVDGKEVELRRMGPGEVFGETAILSDTPRTASVQALESLTVQVVTREELEEGVGANTGLGLFVRTLAERFREVDDRLTQLETSLVRGER